jgi:hypothetical protein
MAKAIKKLGSADKLPSVPAVARELNVELADVKDVYFAEVEAFPQLKLPATQKGVERGVKAGLRAERIAARTGLTVAEVKRLTEDAGLGGQYLGRGRKPGNGTSKPKATSGRRGQPKKDEGKGTSGRRGRGGAKPAAAQRTRGRRGTRAGAADPK